MGDEPAEGADHLLSVISVGTLVLAVGALAMLAFLRRQPTLALLAAGIVAGSLAVTEVLKHVLLTRPPLVPSSVLDNTFPSGHTTVGISLGLAMVMVVPAGLRAAAGLGAAALAAAVGVATVAAGWHRPSDVVAAYLVALAVAAGIGAAMLRWGPPGLSRGYEREASPRSPLRRVRVGAEELVLAVIALGAAALFLLALLRAAGVPWTSAGVGFLLSAGAIAASAAIVVGALVVALGRRGEEAPGA